MFYGNKVGLKAYDDLGIDFVTQPIVNASKDGKLSKMPQVDDVNAPFIPKYVKNALIVTAVIGSIILALGLLTYFGVASHVGFMVHLSPALTQQISTGMIIFGAAFGGGGLIGTSFAYGLERIAHNERKEESSKEVGKSPVKRNSVEESSSSDSESSEGSTNDSTKANSSKKKTSSSDTESSEDSTSDSTKANSLEKDDSTTTPSEEDKDSPKKVNKIKTTLTTVSDTETSNRKQEVYYRRYTSN